jgi:hypothetical protein
LTGGRGTVPVNLAAVARLAERVGEVMIEESLELIELNPVFAGPHEAVAVDASARRRVRVAAPAVAVPSPSSNAVAVR